MGLLMAMSTCLKVKSTICKRRKPNISYMHMCQRGMWNVSMRYQMVATLTMNRTWQIRLGDQCINKVTSGIKLVEGHVQVVYWRCEMSCGISRVADIFSRKAGGRMNSGKSVLVLGCMCRGVSMMEGF